MYLTPPKLQSSTFLIIGPRLSTLNATIKFIIVIVSKVVIRNNVNETIPKLAGAGSLLGNRVSPSSISPVIITRIFRSDIYQE